MDKKDFEQLLYPRHICCTVHGTGCVHWFRPQYDWDLFESIQCQPLLPLFFPDNIFSSPTPWSSSSSSSLTDRQIVDWAVISCLLDPNKQELISVDVIIMATRIMIIVTDWSSWSSSCCRHSFSVGSLLSQPRISFVQALLLLQRHDYVTAIRSWGPTWSFSPLTQCIECW